jgi:hypothetical protein
MNLKIDVFEKEKKLLEWRVKLQGVGLLCVYSKDSF